MVITRTGWVCIGCLATFMAAAVAGNITNDMIEAQTATHWVRYWNMVSWQIARLAGWGWGLSLVVMLLQKFFSDGWKSRLASVVAGAIYLSLFGAVLWGGVMAYDHYSTEWRCVEKGQNMFSISDRGEIGPAEEACTCTGMADFERRNWGRVDYAGLNKDHGCDFD